MNEAILQAKAISPELHERRERVFLILAGLFLGSMTMLNILGITRFVDMSFELFGIQIPFKLAIGVLPYPLTFLCTDFISELYGRKRANWVVWTGLILNLWVYFILWVGAYLPGLETIDPATGQVARDAAGRLPVFFEVRNLTMGAVMASMLAYMAAQFCDVYLFHFWKKLTKGKHLWLRNNGSTMISQIVDSVCVILITHYYAHGLPVDHSSPIGPQLMQFIIASYIFKFTVAALDTIPFYLGVAWLSKYLQIDYTREHEADVEETAAGP